MTQADTPLAVLRDAVAHADAVGGPGQRGYAYQKRLMRARDKRAHQILEAEDEAAALHLLCILVNVSERINNRSVDTDLIYRRAVAVIQIAPAKAQF